jgi:dihydrofolate reductase
MVRSIRSSIADTKKEEEKNQMNEEEFLRQMYGQQAHNNQQTTKDISVVHPKVAVIVAVDIAGGYCKDGKIPWHFKQDMKWFQQQTKGNICVMGRTTYEDMNRMIGEKGKDSVLPNRECYVVSSSMEPVANATVIRSMRGYEQHIKIDDPRTVFILGGYQLFLEGVALADQVIMTVINDSYGCDKYFPVEYVANNFGVTAVQDTDEAKLKFFTWARIKK